MRLFAYSIFSVLLLFSCTGNGETAESADSDGEAILEFQSLVHDFGKITEGEIVACVFSFENSGDEDLIINSAVTSCGCTVPSFPKEPVKPGDQGRIEVVFDSSYRSGAQSKTITIRSNARKPVIVLKITADIETNK
jgi:hypothetical protein